jgi:hypothetical protein
VRALAAALALAALALAAGGCRPPRVVVREPPPLPSDDFGIELTDPHQRVDADMWVDTNAVRIDDSLYFVFAASERRANASPGGVFVRRLDLVADRLGPPVRVFDLVQPRVDNHHLPSLARDASALWVLLPFEDAERNVSHLGCAEDPRRPPPAESCGLAVARRIPDLGDPRSWSPDRRGLPMRMRNTFGYSLLSAGSGWAGLRMIDWISVYDPLARTGYAVGQMLGAERDERPGAAGRFDDLPYGGGFPVGLVRFLPDGRVDGPYLVTGTETDYPGEPVGRCNLMSKPMLRLGRAVGARRRLHLLWVTRCSLIGKSFVSYWDPSYAFSDDGGESWTNLARDAVRRVPERIAWNDRAFRIYEGDVETSSEGGFAVGDDDAIHYLLRRADPPAAGEPAWRDPREGGRAHAAAETNSPRDLVYRRCTPGEGCRQVGGVIERSERRRDQLALASDGTLFAFLEWPLRYRKSRDGGRNWSEAVRIGPPRPTWRMHVNPDPAERDLLHLVLQTTGGEEGDRQLFYVRFDLRQR